MNNQTTTSLPRFPDYRDITILDKQLFDAIFTQRPPEISTYTFTNIFAWRKPRSWRLSELDGALLVHAPDEDGLVCLEPLGVDNPAQTMTRMAELANSQITFRSVHRAVAEAANEHFLAHIELDRDNSDYLYVSSDLIDLPGRKFDAKRNFINRFKQTHTYEYFEITPDHAVECHEFAEQWCEDRTCAADEGLNHERCAVYQMLSHFGELGIVGGAIRVDGQVTAFALGEALNPETLVVHVEKADSSYAGMYQMINNEFCLHEATGYDYVNREQDLGVSGLRKAKKSYQPVRMVDNFRVVVKP